MSGIPRSRLDKAAALGEEAAQKARQQQDALQHRADIEATAQELLDEAKAIGTVALRSIAPDLNISRVDYIWHRPFWVPPSMGKYKRIDHGVVATGWTLVNTSHPESTGELTPRDHTPTGPPIYHNNGLLLSTDGDIHRFTSRTVGFPGTVQEGTVEEAMTPTDIYHHTTITPSRLYGLEAIDAYLSRFIFNNPELSH